MKPVSPKKHWGQNFLRSDTVASRVVGLMEIEPEDCVVEIGPGTGVLTAHLARTRANVMCVEIDPELCRMLEARFAGEEGRIGIRNADILRCALADFVEGSCRIVTNAPYYISSKLMDYFRREYFGITDIHVMLQSEVCDVLLAKPETKDYKAATVIMRLFFQIDRLLDVPRTMFDPEPKVDSAVLRMVPRKGFDPSCAASLGTILAAAFGNRRRKLSNTLARIVERSGASGIQFGFDRRAEEVVPEEYYRLACALAERPHPPGSCHQN